MFYSEQFTSSFFLNFALILHSINSSKSTYNYILLLCVFGECCGGQVAQVGDRREFEVYKLL